MPFSVYSKEIRHNYKKAVVVPMYDERENVVPFCQDLLGIDKDFVVILAVSLSPDGTQKIADSLAQENERLIAIHPLKRDLDAAYCEGFKKALKLGADWIVTMDGDFSHNPQDLPRLFGKGKEYDLVIGSRYVAGGRVMGWPWIRRVINWIARVLNRLILGIRVKDSTSGFRCYNRSLIEHLLSRPLITRGFAFQAEAVLKAEQGNRKICEIPIIFSNRARGRSKLRIENIRGYLVGILRLKWGLVFKSNKRCALSQ